MLLEGLEQPSGLAVCAKSLWTGARPGYDKSVAILPGEILDYVVAYLLSDTHAFSDIAAFSLVSYGFRQVAFRRYFVTFEVRSAAHWDNVCKIPGVPSCARQLKVPTSCVQSPLDTLSKFISLLSLEVDFSSDGLFTQRTRCLFIFKNLTADLTMLKLTFLPRVDTALISLVASHFPSLTTLELSSVERLDEQCCWLCFQESSSCIVYSPIPDIFPSVDHLARSFGKALQPLKRLEHIFLGIFLSDADVLICHFDRCAPAIVLASPRTGFYSPPPFGPDQCVICVTEHAAAVRERERLASGLVGKALPSLKTIGWSSFFSKGGTGDSTQRKTTFCIRTLEEKAELKR
ncbi:hypothetical protein LXA43DRAFT_942349 [Ganoderma leucocontextum]|nr:hypothetical protein LXA43DRAFT_942349 [Ganoderma leucocontextum]